MKRPGDEFLSCSTFTINKHRGIGGRHLLNHIDHRFDSGAGADQLMGYRLGRRLFLLEDSIPNLRFPRVQCIPHHGPQFIGRKRFRQVVKSPHLHDFYSGRNGSIAGNHNNHRIRVHVLDPAENFHAAHAAHFQIRNDHIKGTFFDHFQGAIAIEGIFCVVSCFGQDLDATGADIHLVVDNQYPVIFSGHASPFHLHSPAA